MVVQIDDKKIDVEIYLDENFRSIRYELTAASGEEIDPFDSAFILFLIAKGIASDVGVSLEEIVSEQMKPTDGEYIQ